ncbi:hypothetical protein JCM19241_1334 [Vibrio ishigakensis]|uniref:Uncharacterized protein n=1 Tax=Vibrio ishigakensis TaxID=1481914 RepID=A0A0B8Q8S2_9VIBR|nr:hypothetical protein JCM19241_1334 [Vibrio ishigakensis]
MLPNISPSGTDNSTNSAEAAKAIAIVETEFSEGFKSNNPCQK